MNFYIVDLVLQILHWKMKSYVYHERLFAAFWLHLNYEIDTKLTSLRTAVQHIIYTYKDIGTLFVHRELQLHMQEQQKTLCEGVQNCLALFQTSLSEVSNYN